MRTRNFYFPNNSSVIILRRQNKRRTTNVVEPELRTIIEVASMADNQTMEELLQAPTEGDVPNDVIKLMMFPYSLERTARVCFADTLLLMPKFSSTIKSLLANKDKLFKLSKIPLNENCSAMLLKKLPEKLGDPSKFLIPCDFSGMEVCHALADLADQFITRPKGVAEDVFVKVRKFHFPTNFVVVDFEADPRVNDKAVTLNLNQTTRYSSTYDDMLVNLIDVIDVVREEYAQEILGFSNNFSGDNPTSTSEPIISDSSPFLTPFEGSDFILEEIKAYRKDESISPEIDHADYDSEGDIFLIENLLNDDPFQLPPMDLKQGEVVKEKSFFEEPPKLELKDLPSHLEYAYIEGVDKLPVIIAKDLKVDEK
nr:reverse transcriptase domain-containing protein [Tanacetum cinerariifolium]